MQHFSTYDHTTLFGFEKVMKAWMGLYYTFGSFDQVRRVSFLETNNDGLLY